LFFMDDVDQDLIAKGIAIDLETLRPVFNERIQLVLQQATLQLPDSKWKLNGGRLGRHTEHFGHLIAEMQYMQRAYPNMEW